MARSNFTFKKRQKEIERKKKKMEKQNRKFGKTDTGDENDAAPEATDGPEPVEDVTS